MLHVLTEETDLFAVREEPLVGVEDLLGPSFFMILKNFDLNSKALKPLHRQVLRERVLDFVKTNVGFAELYARIFSKTASIASKIRRTRTASTTGR
jgi:hypothetical protein